MEILNPTADSQIFLNYALAFGFIALVIAIILFLYRLSQTLNQVDDSLMEAEEIMAEAKDAMNDINAIRTTLKSGALGVVTMLAQVVGNAANSVQSNQINK